MKKYILIIILALGIACAANFFGFVRIPWLDLPSFGTDTKKAGMDRINKEVDEQTKVK